MSSRLLSERIKAEAYALGFFACGIAKAGPVAADCADAFRRWLNARGHAGMDYMARNVDKRLDPCLLMPGVKRYILPFILRLSSRHLNHGRLYSMPIRSVISETATIRL